MTARTQALSTLVALAALACARTPSTVETAADGEPPEGRAEPGAEGLAEPDAELLVLCERSYAITVAGTLAESEAIRADFLASCMAKTRARRMSLEAPQWSAYQSCVAQAEDAPALAVCGGHDPAAPVRSAVDEQALDVDKVCAHVMGIVSAESGIAPDQVPSNLAQMCRDSLNEMRSANPVAYQNLANCWMKASSSADIGTCN